MAQIRIDLGARLVDGMDIKFKAPCDCTAVTGLLISYINDTGEVAAESFTFRDSHGNNLAGLGNLFGVGAYVKAILDTARGFAYIQNADTNAYLESKRKEAVLELSAGGWSGNTQTVAASEATATNTVIVSPAPESFGLYGECGVHCTAQADGSLTFSCSSVPSETIRVNVVFFS